MVCNKTKLHLLIQTMNNSDQELKVSRLKLQNRFMIFAFLSMVFGFWYVSSSMQSELERTQYQINTLTDQLGLLQDQTFFMEEELTSQEKLLEDIGDDFSEIGSTLEEANLDSLNELESLVQESSDVILSSQEDSSPSLKSQEILNAEVKDEHEVFLLIGMRDGLTDTLMIAIANEDKEKIVLFSIPRDLYISGNKINAFYNNYGLEQTIRMVERVIGYRVDHYTLLDLDGFVDIVDALEGIEVCIEQSIYDPYYPTESFGYQVFSLEAGCHQLDGETALKLARSRYTTSDFDRAKRQQLIVEAIYEKLLQLHHVMEISELTALFESLAPHVQTDIDLVSGVSFFLKYNDYQIERGLVFSTENYLYSTTTQAGSYILLPRTGDYSAIQAAINSLVE